MVFLQVLPAVLSFLLLAAHFVRAGQPPLVLFVLGLAMLLFVPRAWAARTAQTVLVLGTLEWLRTLVSLVALRAPQGQPYGRAVVILGLVAAATLASSLVFRSRRLRQFYGLGGTETA